MASMNPMIPFGINALLTTPLNLPAGPWITSSQRHGSAEPVYGAAYGGAMGLTPPSTPRSTKRRSENPRSRERDRRSHDNEPDYDEHGSRIAMLEKKVQDLENAISRADSAITKKLVDTNACTHEVSVLVDAIEQHLPQRIHDVERRHVSMTDTLNALAGAINSRIQQIENRLKATAQHTQQSLLVRFVIS